MLSAPTGAAWKPETGFPVAVSCSSMERERKTKQIRGIVGKVYSKMAHRRTWPHQTVYPAYLACADEPSSISSVWLPWLVGSSESFSDTWILPGNRKEACVVWGQVADVVCYPIKETASAQKRTTYREQEPVAAGRDSLYRGVCPWEKYRLRSFEPVEGNALSELGSGLVGSGV